MINLDLSLLASESPAAQSVGDSVIAESRQRPEVKSMTRRWRHMMDRCYRVDHPSYKNYGGRGIRVCERWHDVLKYLGDLPDGYFDGAQLDRIDNNGNYEPGNVRWATVSQNCDNRRTRRELTHNGITQSLRRWSEQTGIGEQTIWERVSVWGWSDEKALTTPPMTAHERMQKAHETRWAGHTKKPPPPPKHFNMVTYEGKQWRAIDLADHVGANRKLFVKQIIERGWPVEKAVAKARGT